MRLRAWILAAAIAFAGPVAASTITERYTSFYVTGDSLSDDGNLFGPFWYFATGGSPYSGSFFTGGTFTNGEVWNEPLLDDFEDAGRDAENFAVARAEADGSILFPDLDRQIDRLLDRTSPGERGAEPLVSIWIGANDVLDALGSTDARRVARKAADGVAAGARRLAALGLDDLVVLNLPDLAWVPRFNLFERDLRAEARAASRAYNRRLARNVGALEAEGIDVVEVDAARLFNRVRRDPGAYGLVEATLPCVFPTDAAAGAYGQPRRCDRATARERLFIDAVHPNARAHAVLGDFVRDAIEAEAAGATRLAAAAAAPAPAPLPPAALLLPAALAGLGLLRRRRARGPHHGLPVLHAVPARRTGAVAEVPHGRLCEGLVGC